MNLTVPETKTPAPARTFKQKCPEKRMNRRSARWRILTVTCQAQTTRYGWDAAVRLTQQTLPNAIKQQMVYDNAGRLTSPIHEASNDTCRHGGGLLAWVGVWVDAWVDVRVDARVNAFTTREQPINS